MKAIVAFFFLGLTVLAYTTYAEVECPAEDAVNATHIASPTNCSLFYTCSGGTAFASLCPSGLHFNQELEVCDWPASANCVAED